LLLVICLAASYRRARREEETLAEQLGEEWQAQDAQRKSLIAFVY